MSWTHFLSYKPSLRGSIARFRLRVWRPGPRSQREGNGMAACCERVGYAAETLAGRARRGVSPLLYCGVGQ